MESGARWTDDDLVLISAIEHWSYCPRQCALINLESTFDENIYTLRGRRVHEQVHSDSVQTEDGIRISRGLPLWSDRLGLIGKADIVEWHGDVPYPVEYKTGKQRKWTHEALQLCAQAMCLEEMLGIEVPLGAIYSAGSKRRREFAFDQAMRDDVTTIVDAIRTMLGQERMPPAVNDPRCPDCSLVDACQPRLIAQPAILRGHYGELFHPNE